MDEGSRGAKPSLRVESCATVRPLFLSHPSHPPLLLTLGLRIAQGTKGSFSAPHSTRSTLPPLLPTLRLSRLASH